MPGTVVPLGGRRSASAGALARGATTGQSERHHVTLNDGDMFSVAFPWTLNVACGFQFSSATRWLDGGN
jgi:hypothetical protein